MAVLLDADRAALWADLMSHVPAGVTIPVTKAQLRACVNAADSVANTNAAALNAAIQAIESSWNTLPVAMRAFIFAQVILVRYTKGV